MSIGTAGPPTSMPTLGAEPRRGSHVRVSATDRIIAGIIAAALLGVLVTASRLTPASDGHGTHTQLGLPACGWYLATGGPCPTCGMTTAFAHMLHMQPLQAVKAQPMGAALALVASVGFWGCVHVAVFGSRLGTLVVRLLSVRVMWAVAILGCAAWAYKFWAISR